MRDWKRHRWYWAYCYADPFAAGLTDFFNAPCLPPAAHIALLPTAPLPERSRRHAALDSFSNVYQVRFELAAPEAVQVTLLDTAGHHVGTIAAGDYLPGTHMEIIDGWAWPGGIYFVHIDTGEQEELAEDRVRTVSRLTGGSRAGRAQADESAACALDPPLPCFRPAFHSLCFVHRSPTWTNDYF